METANTQETIQSKKMAKIEKETGLNFPADSKMVHFFEPLTIIDPVWVAEIIIPTSSYESFRQTLLAKQEDDTIYDKSLASSTSWWNPTNVVLKKQYLADEQTFVVVVLSREADKFSVYIECAVF